MLSVGSLFSGVAGIELGLERTGKFKTKWFCENDAYACAVLQKNFPTVSNIGDVKAVKWSEVEGVDVLTGGFPCQPFSVAGKRKGEKDERALWSFFLEAIRQIKPKWVMAENVPGLLSVDSGRAFRNILASLAQEGYDAEWFTLRASDFGAPHRRERLFIVAYPSKQHSEGSLQEGLRGASGKYDKAALPQPIIVADDWGKRIQRFKQESLQGERGFSWCEDIRRVEDFFQRQDAPEPLIRREDIRISDRLDENRKVFKEVNPINEYGDDAESGRRKIMCDLPTGSSTQSVQRKVGRQGSFPEEEVLQQEMYGGGIYEVKPQTVSISEASTDLEKEKLRNVWCWHFTSRSSQKSAVVGQSPSKLADFVFKLSFETSLEEWKEALEKAVCLHCLWEICEEVGYVPKTLSEVKKVWQSLNDEEKNWCEIQLILGKIRKKSHYNDRIKCLGNAVVPQVAQFIGERIAEAEGGGGV